YFVNSTNEAVKNFAMGLQNTFSGTGANAWVYWVLYFTGVVVATFFYTDVLFAQQNYGENLKKVGAQIPGVNRGAPTQKYLTKVQRRITLPGAFFLGIVAIMPFLLGLIFPQIAQGGGLLLVSSAGLLIVVGVVRDTFLNIEAELKMHGYEDSLIVR
ncbi:MAG: SecY family transport protein, partial [Anaerolineales bacterium]|nr:SecY family transport protein [Anaerolineales bacterium]